MGERRVGLKIAFWKFKSGMIPLLLRVQDLVWLNCYGIPFHVWNATTFNKIGQIWGEIISISKASFNCVSFTVGKVLISTTTMETINQVINLVNKDRKYNVKSF